MHGGKSSDEGRFPAEYVMADRFGWTFEQTRSTPGVVISEMMYRLSQSNEWESRRRELDDQIAKSKQKR